MAAILQTTTLNAFLYEKVRISNIISRTFAPNGTINNKPVLIEIMA